MYDAIFEAIAPFIDNADAVFEYLVNYFGSEKEATQFIVDEDLVWE
ncbi:MAG: hypothetical protein AAFU03_18495 [Bacteroidota bacterium]